MMANFILDRSWHQSRAIIHVKIIKTLNLFLFCIDPYIDSVLFFLPLVQVISTNKYLSFLTVDPHNDDKLEQTDKKQWKTHEGIHQIQNVGPTLFKKKHHGNIIGFQNSSLLMTLAFRNDHSLVC